MDDQFDSLLFSPPTQIWPDSRPLTPPRITARVSGRAAVVIVGLIAGAIVIVAAALVAVALSLHVDALSAAGAFGKGANGQMLKGVSAITESIKTNLLGLVGATIVLVVIGLAAGHIYGDERAHEKTLRVVKGIFMLVAATGFVA